MSSIIWMYLIKADTLVRSWTLLLLVSTKNIVPCSAIIPVGYETPPAPKRPSSVPFVPFPIIVSTFRILFVPSRRAASRENRFNMCDLVSVKMTDWLHKHTPWLWQHLGLPFWNSCRVVPSSRLTTRRTPSVPESASSNFYWPSMTHSPVGLTLSLKFMTVRM